MERKESGAGDINEKELVNAGFKGNFKIFYFF